MTQSGRWRLATELPSSCYNSVTSNTDKAKPTKRWRRKATGPRFLREAKDDSPKDPKTAELPKTKLEQDDENAECN